ncbi:hypothetical protein HPP92_017079 [Vanilla planifolia]|uniref:Glycosyltransferase N-terminal domain-containing protein n=1 Tax=Vanilla planifolia TaxID=51239 RepID=A0A835Q7D9_VANPL|nr:hypothetical protein HPP92_017079 [Vanilla planifolia]
MDNAEHPCFRVMMLPWLAHGHISPFLELARRLSTHNIVVYLCSTPVNLRSVQEGGQFDCLKDFPLIHLVELHLPVVGQGDEDENYLQPHLHTTKNLPTHRMPELKTAFDRAAPDFDRLVCSLSPDVLIYDFLQPWAPIVASRRGIPAVLFLTVAAYTFVIFSHCLLRPPSDTRAAEFAKTLYSVANGLTDGERFLQCIHSSSGFVAIRTFREIEGNYMSHLSAVLGKEILPVGPLLSEAVGSDRGGEDRVEKWLNTREPATVVFASVGTEYFMAEEEIAEMSRGLELSGLFYIWVVRSHGDGGVDETKRRNSGGSVSERGLVLEGWAPQKKILAHASVGVFVTHCGWSSVLEGMSNGVAMVALPMQLDQPLNAELMVHQGGGGGRGRREREEKGEGDDAAHGMQRR